jgi:hypothetical protein
MKTKGITALVLLVGLMVSGIVIPASVSAAPAITIEPDTTFSPNEIVTVSGSGLAANTSVYIDLILPNGAVVPSVAQGMTDASGVFEITFTSPDKAGDGYVKVVAGSYTQSILVVFAGTTVQTLVVTVSPYEPKTNQTFRISIKSTTLISKNYVIILRVTDSEGRIQETYHVLHEGGCSIDRSYAVKGDYIINASVDGMGVWVRETITLTQGSTILDDDDDDGTTNQTLNITWTVNKNGAEYSIYVFVIGVGYLTAENLKLMKPSGSIDDLPMVNGVASFTATSKGDYEVQLVKNGRLYTNTITHNPTARLTISSFSDSGTAQVSFTIDGEYPEEGVSVEILGEDTDTEYTLLLTNGQGTFSAGQPEPYHFSVDYQGTTATANAEWRDNYLIEGLSAIQTSSYDAIIVSGTMSGEKSGRGIPNTLVKITINDLGYTGTVKTDTNGGFRLTISLPASERGGIVGGATYQVDAKYGTSVSALASVHVEHDFWGEYGFWVLGGLLLMTVFLYFTGILTWLSKGRIPKWGEGGGWFGHSGGKQREVGAKSLQPGNIELVPPEQFSG